MKTICIQLSLASVLLLGLYSCKKGEAVGKDYEASATADSAAALTSDSISSVATMNVKDKQFVKTADVNMEVQDVYETTISIEKTVQEMGGFVTNSNLQSSVLSEETYNTSDKDAMLVKKYQTENSMKVRIPTHNLGEFLSLINQKKLFLNSRSISAEDVTAGIQYAALERKRMKTTADHISELKSSKDKVKLSDENMSEDNIRQLANMDITDRLKYSTVDIFIKEPKLRISEISVTNTAHTDNKYRISFIYSMKNAFAEGYYLIQEIVVLLVTIWPLWMIALLIFIFIKRRRTAGKIRKTVSE
ncbi:DUF4349 domain-containing protein [uncultured Chryseobacterium sp.]|uniref:DUF4349 domain-containing protein n=1 Tax=uncultured Chryseobacterium sp. TaxID=259322 RepID=UPI0025CE30CA|nr:DUF4349 domain-containing protein [uncultured Chryseobacterium sp.]